MESRIKNDKSQLTSKSKVYNLPEQLTLTLEEKLLPTMYIKNSGGSANEKV